MADNLADKIEEAASQPRRASGDAGSIEQHPLTEQIAVAKHLESKKASRLPGLGVKLVKLSPGGTA